MNLLAPLLATLALAPSSPTAAPFRDEMDKPSLWSVYSPGHPPTIAAPRKGLLQLSLPHVEWGWPYAYQWTGVRRTVELDIRRFPILEAQVSDVQRGSYAHVEFDVLDEHGKSVQLAGRAERSFRSGTTLVKPGTIVWDLGKELDPATYTVDLRLILGGDNAGCSVAYDSVRTLPRR